MYHDPGIHPGEASEVTQQTDGFGLFGGWLGGWVLPSDSVCPCQAGDVRKAQVVSNLVGNKLAKCVASGEHAVIFSTQVLSAPSGREPALPVAAALCLQQLLNGRLPQP